MDYPKFRGRWDMSAPVQDPAPRSLSPAPGARETANPNVTVHSLPMGHGGGNPIPDLELLAAKRLLSNRAGQIYNKGGLQYLSDEDWKQFRLGELRRRNQ